MCLCGRSNVILFYETACPSFFYETRWLSAEPAVMSPTHSIIVDSATASIYEEVDYSINININSINSDTLLLLYI